MPKHLFTSESVTEGHPDKLCDQISDATLDAVLRQDPKGRVACETYVTMGLIIVGGEITTTGYVDIHQVVRNLLRDIGYTDPKFGLDYKTCAIMNAIHGQSPDIAQGVDPGGAGDQGMMMGYACRETPELMPLPIMLAHRLCRRAAEARKTGLLPYLGPDGKSQVTVEYVDGKPQRVASVVLACQHTEEVLDRSKSRITKEAREQLIETIVRPVLGTWANHKIQYLVNETGKFVVGGPQSDTGMTGRKNIVDTYGGIVGHGGGAFSGKDPTKVDRSATYMARSIAKHLVAAGLAERCYVQLAYCIGRAEPLAVTIDTYGTASLSDEQLLRLVTEVFPLTPRGIIEALNLSRPIYRQTACYGHFGRTEDGFTWEILNRLEEVKRVARQLGRVRSTSHRTQARPHAIRHR